ncbi:uncharacterized protein LOC124920995 [Impatiens glandulifera]|uniref:uncharacterized protein LOC124920995 n=1 Tax=Impatiens glandulifera TaxID=253017 RepID=UPI001FB17638|nr:uncharacterized protein LOC124920995 [Impatiens glandulifera]
MDKLQWGSRKRLRCMKIKESGLGDKSEGSGNALKKKITNRVDRRVVESADNNKHSVSSSPFQSPHRVSSRDLGTNGGTIANENGKMLSSCFSPDKEDRYYTTRGSVVGGLDESSSSKVFVDQTKEEKNKKKMVWPRLFVTLSTKEKEEDFMAMKGCKLPQRPKKRAKLIQRSLLLVSPGAWLTDLCQERYEVREKKTSNSKKRPGGLKAMGTMESDTE